MCLTDDENKLIVSGGNEYGYENYKCIAQKCKEYNLFFNPSNRVCYSPENIPVNTFYNTDLDHSVETDLSECLKQIIDARNAILYAKHALLKGQIGKIIALLVLILIEY